MLVIEFDIDKNIDEIINTLDERDIYRVVEDGRVKKLGIIGGEKDLEKLKKEFRIDKYYIAKSPYKFASREFRQEDTVVEVKGAKIGGNNFAVMAGPCSIENREMIFESAKRVKEAGASILRGGAFKPRTSPYSFQGLGKEGLEYMREAADKYNLAMVTELMDETQFELVEKYTDIIQIGARNMQNFSLLKRVGTSSKPILLKRGMAASVEDLLMAAEYIIAHGNMNVILCERGIRTFETTTRNTLDLNSVAVVRELSHLPIILDASHGTGKRSLVPKLTLAGIAVGANGAMVEVHPNPQCALSDGPQSLTFEEFDKLTEKMRAYLELEKKDLT